MAKNNKKQLLTVLKDSTSQLLKSVRMEFKQNFKDMDDLRERTFELAATQEKLILGASVSIDSETSKKAADIVDKFWKEVQALHLEELRRCNQLQEIIKACRQQLQVAGRVHIPKS